MLLSNFYTATKISVKRSRCKQPIVLYCAMMLMLFCLFSFPNTSRHLANRSLLTWCGETALPAAPALWPGGQQLPWRGQRPWPSRYLGKDLMSDIIKNSAFRTWSKIHGNHRQFFNDGINLSIIRFSLEEGTHRIFAQSLAMSVNLSHFYQHTQTDSSVAHTVMLSRTCCCSFHFKCFALEICLMFHTLVTLVVVLLSTVWCLLF